MLLVDGPYVYIHLVEGEAARSSGEARLRYAREQMSREEFLRVSADLSGMPASEQEG